MSGSTSCTPLLDSGGQAFAELARRARELVGTVLARRGVSSVALVAYSSGVKVDELNQLLDELGECVMRCADRLEAAAKALSR